MKPEMEIGNYYDNAAVLATAIRKLKAGESVEADCILSTLRNHIRENPDPKRAKWLVPSIERLIQAATQVTMESVLSGKAACVTASRQNCSIGNRVL